MADRCYLDTTVLVEALFKTPARRRRAKAAIGAFSGSSVSVYAIKEMHAGAMSYLIWLFNKLSETRSLAKTMEAIGAVWMQRNRMATALEMLAALQSEVVGAELSDAWNPFQTDRMLADMHMQSLRRIILNGWRDRRRLTTEVVDELKCFPEESPFYDEELKMLVMTRRGCPTNRDCSYAPKLRSRPRELENLLKVIEGSTRAEDNRRRKALRTLFNTPNRKFEDKQCRDLGDAYFALHCPSDSVILTSNVKDHQPLAAALGKSVAEYTWKE